MEGDKNAGGKRPCPQGNDAISRSWLHRYSQRHVISAQKYAMHRHDKIWNKEDTRINGFKKEKGRVSWRILE